MTTALHDKREEHQRPARAKSSVTTIPSALPSESSLEVAGCFSSAQTEDAMSPRVALRSLLSLALLSLACFQPSAAAQESSKRPVVEVAICLDVSSSMDGLIASAKRKLWDIVNDLARAKPTPELRVALFSYGNNAYDPKTGWVRQELALTSDLDRVSEKLVALQATKIPSSEEYVARVCRDATERLQWSA